MGMCGDRIRRLAVSVRWLHGEAAPPAGQRRNRLTDSTTHAGLAWPSISTVMVITACTPAPPGNSSADESMAEARSRDPDSTGCGNRTRLTP